MRQDMPTTLKPTSPGVPLVSVVIPTFNGERYLPQTLGAVLAQTHQALEIIVVDDGSSDGSLELVRSLAPLAVILQQANAGVSNARNRGLAAARGEFVIFLDQDDVWNPLQLERQLAWMAQRPECGVVVCPYHHWRSIGGGYPDPRTVWPADPGLTALPDFTGWVYHQFLWDCWAQTSGTLMRREVVLACGGYDATLAYSEDWDLWLRLSLRTQFGALAWPPVLYRHHAVQGSRTVREHDFRTALLLRYAARHGLASADGRAMDKSRFGGIIARYQAEFGAHHLQFGQRWIGVRSLLAAWVRAPARWRYLAKALAGAAGWRPKA
jgi:glycosyltransferase involved in cell wall biosynthesis